MDILPLSDADYDRILNVVHERAAAWAEEHGAGLIRGVNETTREGVREATASAIREGITMDDLADRLDEAWVFGEDRALMIARTETCFAQVAGTIQSYEEAGIQQKEWLMADSLPCTDCEELNGEIVGIDEQFSNGLDGPPDHPNCRCDVLPVIPEPDAQE